VRAGRKLSTIGAAVRALQVGQSTYIDTPREKNTAYCAARYVGYKLQILLTTAGRWRAERVA
jgi:hypothetical protein